jgi:hypothetical protein
MQSKKTSESSFSRCRLLKDRRTQKSLFNSSRTLSSRRSHSGPLCRLIRKSPYLAMILTGNSNNLQPREHTLLVAYHQGVDLQQADHVPECPRVYRLAHKDLLPCLQHSQLQQTLSLKFNKR